MFVSWFNEGLSSNPRGKRRRGKEIELETSLYLLVFPCYRLNIPSYHVKIIPPTRKREAVTRELRLFTGKVFPLIGLKVKLMEQFENLIPTTTKFNVGYFAGRQSENRWICDKDDLEAMYSSSSLSGKDIVLWCDGCPEDSDSDNS